MPITYADIAHKLQPPLDCAEIPDLRGQYFYNRLILNYENTDFTGCVLYHCFPSGIANAVEVSPAQSESDVSLKRADLRRANLERANLERANLQGANLRGANLQGANLRGANLQGANLERSDLERADLQDANLQGASLINANLQGANLRGADLQDANLQGAYLEGAYLEGANLSNANLKEADLTEADLTLTIFTEANLQGAKYDNHTKLTNNPRTSIQFTQEQLGSMLYFDDGWS